MNSICQHMTWRGYTLTHARFNTNDETDGGEERAKERERERESDPESINL